MITGMIVVTLWTNTSCVEAKTDYNSKLELMKYDFLLVGKVM